MKVLLAAAECSPLARTGGLGEMVAGLGHALRGRGIEATVVIPRYQSIGSLGVKEPAPAPAAAIYRYDADGLPVLLIDDPESFDRPGIYGPEPGTGYEDQWFRFGRFSSVVRELAADHDLVHLHDCHVAPAVLGAAVPTVLTIHNASYTILGPLDETADLVGASDTDRAPGGPIEWFGEANFLKAGVERADVLTTVSPTFANQLLSDGSISGGLDTVLNDRSRPIIGILNAIDTASWDPETDKTLPATFSRDDLAGRDAARAELFAVSELDTDGMLLGTVTRVTEQKGIGLLHPNIDELVSEGMRLIIVGNGDLDDIVDHWVARHPTAIWHAPYDEKLARLVSAGVDAYLMPSRFEPCGLGQMYAMRYGAPPIVRLTGGLADTVIDIDEQSESATGFGFRSFAPMSLAKTIRRAMRVFTVDHEEWKRLQRNGMATDFSWDNSASEYVSVYESVL